VSVVSLLLALVSFAGCVVGGLWLVGELAAHRDLGEKTPVTARTSDDPWIAQPEGSIAGTHVWAGHSASGVLRSPADCEAIVVGPPRSGKTRKVIAPTLACWYGPALVTSTKGDILATAEYRAQCGPVVVYDPTGSLGHPEATVGSPR
jgi:type IV secretory pathway TraG/TraD family ATPase VirD4